MGTLIKRKGLFPSIVNKSANDFFDDYITKDLFDWTDENFDALDSKLSYANSKEIDANIAVPEIKSNNFKVEIYDDPLIFAEKETVRMGANFARKGFNYRSFCRLPNY